MKSTDFSSFHISYHFKSDVSVRGLRVDRLFSLMIIYLKFSLFGVSNKTCDEDFPFTHASSMETYATISFKTYSIAICACLTSRCFCVVPTCMENFFPFTNENDESFHLATDKHISRCLL